MKERLKALRAALKITQFELADKANIGRSTYAMFETGSRALKDIHISAICSATGASEEWLKNGTGDMFAPADDSALDQLVAKHHLRPMERAMLEAFAKLPEAYRDGVMEYAKALVAAVVADSQQYQAIADRQAAQENQVLREAFGLPRNDDDDGDGNQKAHA